MGKENEAPAPIEQSVHVDCSPEDAFRMFTEGFGEWWPLARYTVDGDAAECELEPWAGGRVVERTRSGGERLWGSVRVWDPPDRLEFSWHPGSPPDDDQTVTVDFRVEADGTRVTLTHRGWYWAGAATCISRFAGFVCAELQAVA